MKITKLRITNFRCFKDATLPIAPITLVTGPNSAGKSSLFAPLLASAQTDGMPAMLSPNGRYINMGDFLDMVHRGRKDANIGITINALSDRGTPLDIDSVFAFDSVARTPRLKALSVTGSYYHMSVKDDQLNYQLNYRVTPADSTYITTMLGNTKFTDFFDAMNKLFADTMAEADQEDIPELCPSQASRLKACVIPRP